MRATAESALEELAPLLTQTPAPLQQIGELKATHAQQEAELRSLMEEASLRAVAEAKKAQVRAQKLRRKVSTHCTDCAPAAIWPRER